MPINTNPPYAIGPKDLTKEMLEHNLPPTLERLREMISKGEAFDAHDEKIFNPAVIASRRELDSEALKQGKLAAPRLVVHQSIMDLMARMMAFVDKVRPGMGDESLMKDAPEAFMADPEKTRISACVATCTKICIESCNIVSTAIIMERMKHGLDANLNSLVGQMPDALPDADEGENCMSLVNIHCIDDEVGGGFMFFTLFLP